MKIEPLVKTLSFLLLLALPVNLAACVGFNSAVPPAATAFLQPVYQTEEVRLTQAVTPAPAAQATLGPVVQAETGPTPAPVAFQKPAGCDRIAPGHPIDVTVPDGYPLQPGQTFSKTWRLVYAGECAWSRDYSVVFFSGQPMGLAGHQMISSSVSPGEVMDITVDMIAPETPGRYQSNWKLRNQDGQLFGLGPNGDSPFWVQIEVVAVESAVAVVPLPSLTPTLPVFSAGVVNLLPADRLDLDSGSLNQDEFVDVTFDNGDPAQPSFDPTNGARLFVYGSVEPDEVTCQSGALDFNAVVLDGVENGLYVCYRTSQGLPGYLHVIRPVPEEAALSLDFVTWTVP